MTNPRSSTTLSTPQGLANPSSLAAAVTPLPLTSAPAPAPAPASAPPPPPPPPPFVGAWVDLSVPPPPPPIPSLRDWATDYYGRVLYEHVLAVSQDREPTPELFVCVFVEMWAMMAALDPVGAAWFAEWCELNRHPTW